MEKFRIIFSGSGGQGIITAAVILAEAAVIYENMMAVQSQVYGPQARGGVSRSDVIISDSEIDFPKVIQPNMLVCLTQASYNKYSAMIRPGGLLLSDEKYVTTDRKADARQISLPMYTTVMETIKKPVVFNLCVLGVLISLTNLVKPESIMKVLETRIPSEVLKVNRQALHLGIKMGAEYCRS
ncbi:MAG: 2-oxoacid:acceptor oxidoreductase family protein [Desulfobacterales bacterium]|nr:2-oxoacid:acceptor oxidoreductase family protein [Desulfobacterales bacterium]